MPVAIELHHQGLTFRALPFLASRSCLNLAIAVSETTYTFRSLCTNVMTLFVKKKKHPCAYKAFLGLRLFLHLTVFGLFPSVLFVFSSLTTKTLIRLRFAH